MNTQFKNNYYGFTDSRFVITKLTWVQSRKIIPKYHAETETRTGKEQADHAIKTWRDHNHRPKYKSSRGLESFDLKHCHECNTTMCECVK